MKKYAQPRIARHPASIKAEANPIPQLKAADVLKDEHVYHPQFVKWLTARGVEASKRQARKFLATNPILRRAWESVWKQHDRKEAA